MMGKGYTYSWKKTGPLLLLMISVTLLHANNTEIVPTMIKFNGFKVGSQVDLKDYRKIISDLHDIIRGQPQIVFAGSSELIPQAFFAGNNPCLDLSCLLKEAKESGSRLILTGNIRKNNSDYIISIWLLMAGSGANAFNQSIRIPVKVAGTVGGREVAKYLVYGMNRTFPGIVIPVTSRPDNATLYIDGKEIGTTPTRILVRERFSYTFSARQGYSVSEAKTITFGNRSEKTVHLKLIPEPGVLEITGWPTNSIVRIDGKKMGTLPKTRVKAKPGTYDVKVKRSGYYAFKKSAVINPAALTELNVRLKKKPKGLALAASTVMPGAGHFIYRKPVRGILFFAASAAIGYYGYDQYLMYLNRTNDYKTKLDNFKRYPDLNTWDESEQEIRETYLAAKEKTEMMNQVMNAYGAIWAITILELAIDL